MKINWTKIQGLWKKTLFLCVLSLRATVFISNDRKVLKVSQTPWMWVNIHLPILPSDIIKSRDSADSAFEKEESILIHCLSHFTFVLLVDYVNILLAAFILKTSCWFRGKTKPKGSTGCQDILAVYQNISKIVILWIFVFHTNFQL